ncbi:hypothetical protein [Fluoribacter dumoffii]|uniref:hypothetical protein n=1 Tax=Fluoribacter dumoffii TaxID=463 RepID=UPI00026C7A4D|nr:hypothetical protein [Fluoribacter dumoffii]
MNEKKERKLAFEKGRYAMDYYLLPRVKQSGITYDPYTIKFQCKEISGDYYAGAVSALDKFLVGNKSVIERLSLEQKHELERLSDSNSCYRYPFKENAFDEAHNLIILNYWRGLCFKKHLLNLLKKQNAALVRLVSHTHSLPTPAPYLPIIEPYVPKPVPYHPSFDLPIIEPLLGEEKRSTAYIPSSTGSIINSSSYNTNQEEEEDTLGMLINSDVESVEELLEEDDHYTAQFDEREKSYPGENEDTVQSAPDNEFNPIPPLQMGEILHTDSCQSQNSRKGYFVSDALPPLVDSSATRKRKRQEFTIPTLTNTQLQGISTAHTTTTGRARMRQKQLPTNVSAANIKLEGNSTPGSRSLTPARKRPKQDGRPGLSLESFLDERVISLIKEIPALEYYNSKIKILGNTWELVLNVEINKAKVKDIISKHAYYFIFEADHSQFVRDEMLNINYSFFLKGLEEISHDLMPYFKVQEGNDINSAKGKAKAKSGSKSTSNVTEIIHNLYSQILALRCVKEIYADPDNPMAFPQVPISEEEAILDFKQLMKKSAEYVSRGYSDDSSYPLYHTVEFSKYDKVGKLAVEFFTRIERYKATYGGKTESAYSVWETNSSPVTYKLREVFRQRCAKVDITTVPVSKAGSIGIKEISQVLTRQFVSSQYSPTVLMQVIEVLKKHYQFKAERIQFLDLCGGWGARKIAALAHPSIDSYLSIDPNPALIEPYERMTQLFKPLSGKEQFKSEHISKKIEEVVIDPDKIGSFNLAITSPPYRNFELYNKKADGSYEEQQYANDDNWHNFLAHCMWVLSLYVADGGLIALNLANVIYLRKCYFLTGDVVNAALSRLVERLPLEAVEREETVNLYKAMNIDIPTNRHNIDPSTLSYPLEFQGSIIQRDSDRSNLHKKIRKDPRFIEIYNEQIPSDRESYVVFRKIAVLPKLSNCLRLNGLFKTVFKSETKVCNTEPEAVRERHKLQIFTKENKIYDKSAEGEQESQTP